MTQYEVYNYTDTDTYEDICERYDIPLTELLRINNIPQPLPSEYPKDTEWLRGNLLVPAKASDVPMRKPQRRAKRWYEESVSWRDIGYKSQNKCYMTVYGSTVFTIVFPCMPQSYSDSRTANYTSQNPLGRSEPFQIYENSGPRTVSVSFQMHREMTHTDPIEDVVKAVQAATYPIAWTGTIPPKVRLVIGNACVIEGIIAGGVDVTWSETIDKNWKYNMVDLSFTVTECTGKPQTMSDVLHGTVNYGY